MINDMYMQRDENIMVEMIAWKIIVIERIIKCKNSYNKSSDLKKTYS